MTAEQTSTSRARTDGPGGCRDLEDLDPEDLLGRVARGDHGAFGRLCTAVSDPVYGVVLSVLADRAEAEEVTGRVLVAVWRTAPRYEPGQATAIAWLMALAARLATTPAAVTTTIHQALTRLGDHPEPATATITATPQQRCELVDDATTTRRTSHPAHLRHRWWYCPPSSWPAKPRHGDE